MIHRITKDGKIESLKDWSSWTGIVDDEDNIYVTLSMGNKDEETVMTFNPEEFEDFRRLLIFTKRQLVDRIKAKAKLEEAEEKEFFE